VYYTSSFENIREIGNKGKLDLILSSAPLVI